MQCPASQRVPNLKEIPVLHYLAELGKCFQGKSTVMTRLLPCPKIFQK